MKVCQLCAVDFTLHHFLLPLIDGMQREGWQVVSVCADGKYISELRQRGYAIETVPIARSMNPLANLRALGSLIRLFRREKFDVLHAHTPVAALIGRIAARFSGIPLVVYTAHGFYFHDEMPAWKRRLFVWLEKFGGRLTHLLFTQSAEDAQAAVTEKIMAADRVTAIGNGVDPARFDPVVIGVQTELRRALGVGDDDLLIGMIGRMVAEKGVAEFLDASRLLATRYPHARFLLVGERLVSDHAGPVDAAVRAAQQVLGARLILAGMRRDIPQLLAAMDVFCLPSYREGMPRTIIEAMMMARPVIATQIRGSREEVVEGETGLLVPTRDAVALADAIARCIAQPEWARQLGAAGRTRALELYDEHRIVARQTDIIRNFVRRRGSFRNAL